MVADGVVLAGVFSEGVDGLSQLVMQSSIAIDGGKAWEQRLDFNSKSFEVTILPNYYHSY